MYYYLYVMLIRERSLILNADVGMVWKKLWVNANIIYVFQSLKVLTVFWSFADDNSTQKVWDIKEITRKMLSRSFQIDISVCSSSILCPRSHFCASFFLLDIWNGEKHIWFPSFYNIYYSTQQKLLILHQIYLL